MMFMLALKLLLANFCCACSRITLSALCILQQFVSGICLIAQLHLNGLPYF